MGTTEATRTSDPTYNVISILYHSLQEASTSDRYIADAEEQGESDIAEFLRWVQDRDREAIDRAKALLKTRL